MLAKEYQHQDVSGWLMSEKLDGVRAYWDGKQLISRQGNVFRPSSEFTQDFPPFAMDGELFSRRGEFEQISATVRKQEADWQDIRFYVFDVPHASGSLTQRLEQAQKHLQRFPNAKFRVIEQIPVRNTEHMRQFLRSIEKAGGEGVIVRNPNLPYQAGRSSGYLKLKSRYDAECIVTRHHEGKGKYSGMMGSLSCQNQMGEFRIGSGFSDAERKNPPPIGATITFRYRGLTKKGLPRFATYWREKTI